jgi:hypothetical protein
MAAQPVMGPGSPTLLPLDVVCDVTRNTQRLGDVTRCSLGAIVLSL